ncbi:GNAT family N-acetyltransferase [Micromonospora sp. Llam7]|uniref:GNAT family N-acetyltransferase n=1 Tax=Micromonospora tarapacensis TaxID=2835305 RepID=UPI001C831D22|nr:GNAT family N-acetyltransferase [Micromonospora tarapacensis]MBX7268187.1 GNAT family N-acetyltransferase [Micromonospora tarapacensis]
MTVSAPAPVPDTAQLPVVPAGEEDLEWALKLQYLCYQIEGERYDAWQLPALTQTLAEIRDDPVGQVFLVVRLGDEVVGSVRGHVDGGVCHVGRVVVHPRVRRQGLAPRLLAAIEEAIPGVTTYEAFTGHRSEEFLGLYRAAGYRVDREETVSPVLRLVHLRRSVA